MKKFFLLLFFFFSFCLPSSAITDLGNKRCVVSDLLGRYWNVATHLCYMYVYNTSSGQYWRHSASSCPTQEVCNSLCTGELTYYPTYNITGDTYLGTCFADADCAKNVPSVDTDNDGATDYCEANFYVTSWQEMWNPNIASFCQPTDADDDYISDTVEELIGTDPEVADEMCSANYTNYAVTNYDPIAHTYSVGFYLTDDRFYVLDIFSIPAMPAFGTPYTYTLGNYGEVPCGITLIIYEYADGIPTFEVTPLSDPADTTGPEIEWNGLTLPDYDGDSGFNGLGDDVTQGYNNSDTATEVWDQMTTPLPDIILPGSTEATVQIDPKDIAQGVALALNHVTESDLTDILETNDADINWALSSTQDMFSDFGDTGFEDGEVITSGDTETALGVLSWIEDFWTVPEIGKKSSFTIEGFEVFGMQFPDIVLNFDYEIVIAIRILFLFFFYLSCVWIFFRLTRYAWG